MENYFSTFCHISEYEQEGYQNLHRMISASIPLVLWSPSSILLDKCYYEGKSRISRTNLIKYIEKGLVRVIGRESWLLDSKYRQNHSWEGAKWVDEFDGSLKAICKNDEGLPRNQQRVRVVEDEDGYQWAEKIISEEPQIITDISQIITNGHLPSGTKDRINRVDNIPDAVKEVLRDVRNHARAFDLAEVEAPFISNYDADFFKIVEDQCFLSRESENQNEDDKNAHHIIKRTLDLLEQLEQLEIPMDSGKFIGTSSHIECAKWLHNVFELSKETTNNNILATVLLYEIREGHFKDPKSLRSILGIPDDRFGQVTSVGNLVAKIFSGVFSWGALAAIGISIQSIILGRGILRRLGVISPEYVGISWPYLFAFGRNPTPKDVQFMKDNLKKYLQFRES